jgi:hypothetical protein
LLCLLSRVFFLSLALRTSRLAAVSQPDGTFVLGGGTARCTQREVARELVVFANRCLCLRSDHILIIVFVWLGSAFVCQPILCILVAPKWFGAALLFRSRLFVAARTPPDVRKCNICLVTGNVSYRE